MKNYSPSIIMKMYKIIIVKYTLLMKKKMIMVLLVFVFVLGIILLIIFRQQSISQNPNTYGNFSISLQRGGCYGVCPIYSLTIFSDGTVYYQGELYVKITGNKNIKISNEQLKSLRDAIEKADYFSLNNNYQRKDSTDNPSAITSVIIESKSKTINHYLGDNSAPQKLIDFENSIDRIVNSDQWIK